MKSRSLLTQVLTVNVLLIAGTVVLTMVAVNARIGSVVRGREMIVVALALVATLLGNWLVLRTRFKPLDELISAMERTDLIGSREPWRPSRTDSSEVLRLEIAFERVIVRIAAQRPAVGRVAGTADGRWGRRVEHDVREWGHA